MNDYEQKIPESEMGDVEMMDEVTVTGAASEVTGLLINGLQGAAEQVNSTARSQPSILMTDPSSPSKHGDEQPLPPSARKRPLDETDPMMPKIPPPAMRLNKLHQKRASASPEKFFGFQPLSVQTDVPPAIRPWTGNKLEIAYDSVGTPRIASATPLSGPNILKTTLFTAPRGRTQSNATPKKVFSLLGAFCNDNALLLVLVSYLTIPSLINLYAMSKHFHYLFNSHTTAYILAITRTWAPKAEVIFPWRCYKNLCIKDPGMRQKKGWKGDAHLRRGKEKHAELRDVPTIRWLQMVVYRQGVCKDLLVQMAVKGLRCPKGTLDAVKRLWFMQDLPLNVQRIALARNTTYITNSVIMASTMFFLKLDMFFTDPAGQVYGPTQLHTNTFAYPRQWEGKGFVGCDLRELLLAEKSFTPLWRVLRGWSWDPRDGPVPMNRLDILRLWIRHKYKVPDDAPEHVQKQTIMGIPWWEVGTASLERTGMAVVRVNETKSHPIIHPGIVSKESQSHAQGQRGLPPLQKRIVVPGAKPREPLLRPDQLVLREAICRKMGVHRHWARMMLWGFCDEMGRSYRDLSEEEILRWSNGQKPENIFHPLRSKKDKPVAPTAEVQQNDAQEGGSSE